MLSIYFVSFPSNTVQRDALGECRTYPLLRQLSSPLVFAVPQQLNNSSLIRCQSGDLLDDLTDERSALAQVALGTGDTWLADKGGGFLQCFHTMVSRLLAQTLQELS
jgi:hypothetical protein